jgi:hypothetical protein
MSGFERACVFTAMTSFIVFVVGLLALLMS